MWCNFLNSLNLSLDVRSLWSKVKSLGSNYVEKFPHIIGNDNIIDNPNELANEFSKLWSSVSSDAKLS